MSQAHHGGVNVGGNVTVGGDLNANQSSYIGQEPTFAVSDELRDRVDDLLDALHASGLSSAPPLGQLAAELRTEVEGVTARRVRIEQILGAIEGHAVQIGAIAAAITATRFALNR